MSRQYKSALKQLGTLGGGNHFIELQKDQDGWMWIMIHSGSRNIGLQVAEYYDKVAKHLDAQWFSKVNPDIDLAFLPVGCKEFKDYWKEMEYCVQFALANRRLMMDRICGVLKDCAPDAFMSCSHGAGRRMSRTEAVNTLDLKAEQAKLEAKGIVHGVRCRKDLEEASSAYKDIEEVMANQTDLAKITTALEPIAVIKGVSSTSPAASPCACRQFRQRT